MIVNGGSDICVRVCNDGYEIAGLEDVAGSWVTATFSKPGRPGKIILDGPIEIKVPSQGLIDMKLPYVDAPGWIHGEFQFWLHDGYTLSIPFHFKMV